MYAYFQQNAATVRATFPLSFQPSRPFLETVASHGFEFCESILALSLLVLASPVLLLCVAIIKFTSKGPALYKQQRVGKEGKLFTILKLRTMRLDAEIATGPVLSWAKDPRVTAFGNFLRRTHLDEVPQLWNVIRGDMRLVGPRPERPFFVEKFRNDVSYYAKREKVKPGITGLAQVCCGYDASAAEKLEFDLLYIQHRYSLTMYFLILLYTAKKVLLARTA